MQSPGLRRVKPKVLFGFTVSSDGTQMGEASLAVDGIQKWLSQASGVVAVPGWGWGLLPGDQDISP